MIMSMLNYAWPEPMAQKLTTSLRLLRRKSSSVFEKVVLVFIENKQVKFACSTVRFGCPWWFCVVTLNLSQTLNLYCMKSKALRKTKLRHMIDIIHFFLLFLNLILLIHCLSNIHKLCVSLVKAKHFNLTVHMCCRMHTKYSH